jgi:hypothetical protein
MTVPHMSHPTNVVTAQRQYSPDTLEGWVSGSGGSGSGTHLKDIPKLLALVAGCRLLVARSWLLVAAAGCWLLVAWWLLVAGCWLLFAVCRLLVVGGGEEGPKKRNRPKKVQIKKIEKTVFKFLKPEKRSAAARNRTHAAGPKKQMSYRRATAPNQDSPVTVRVETVDG